MNTKFNKSSIYIQFGDVLSVDLSQLTTYDLEYYTNELYNLKSNIPVPSNASIIKYMNSDEYIDVNDTDEFIFFVKKLFQQYNLIIQYINTLT